MQERIDAAARAREPYSALAGLPAIVDYVPAGQTGCAEPGPQTNPGASGGSSFERGTSDAGPRFHTDTIKPREKVYITTSTGAISSISMAIAKAGPGATCATTGATR